MSYNDLGTAKWPTGEQVVLTIAGEASRCLLAFSGGKDSIAAWLAIRDNLQVVPFYKYLVPDLEFVEEGLRYFEDFFGVKILRVPHPSLYRMLRAGVFQPPERMSVVESFGLASFDHDDLRDELAEDHGIDPRWCAIGTRSADSINRLRAFTKWGPIQRRKCNFFPVWDMRKDVLIDSLRRHGVKLPAEYRIFGRSFDGLDFRFLWGIKKHFPRDYRRILEWFPLAELEIKRYEFAAH